VLRHAGVSAAGKDSRGSGPKTTESPKKKLVGREKSAQERTKKRTTGREINGKMGLRRLLTNGGGGDDFGVGQFSKEKINKRGEIKGWTKNGTKKGIVKDSGAESAKKRGGIHLPSAQMDRDGNMPEREGNNPPMSVFLIRSKPSRKEKVKKRILLGTRRFSHGERTNRGNDGGCKGTMLWQSVKEKKLEGGVTAAKDGSSSGEDKNIKTRRWRRSKT